jgi:hypothetical protein
MPSFEKNPAYWRAWSEQMNHRLAKAREDEARGRLLRAEQRLERAQRWIDKELNEGYPLKADTDGETERAAIKRLQDRALHNGY